VLQECACGEPLPDHLRTCPRCGTRNLAHREPRWRTFWPDVDSLGGADNTITLGYWGAFLAAGLGALASLIGRNPLGLVDALLYALCGVGIWSKWRTAAVVAALLFLLNVVVSVARGTGIGVFTIFILIGLVNGLRGTFARAKLSRTARPDVART
jgi:hypothetical protein